MIFSKEIAGLKAQIITLEGQVAVLISEKVTLIQEHATAIEALNTTHATEIAARDTRIKELQDAATASASNEQTRIDAEVTKRLASAGVAPIARDPQVPAGENKPSAPPLKGLAKARALLAEKHNKPA